MSLTKCFFIRDVAKRRDELLNSEAEAMGRVRGWRGQGACSSRCLRHLTMTVMLQRSRKASLCKQKKTIQTGIH